MEDVIIRYVDMPTRVRGVTVLDEEGDYNIYVNPKLSYEMQKKVLQHELKHVKNNDFYNGKSIREKEEG